MGLPGLDSQMWKIPGCVVKISIEDLVKKYQRNIIVVDGFQFYAQLYSSFDWVCGAFKDLERAVHDFVQAFQRIGVKLVFFFVDGNLDEGADRCGSGSWVKRHSEFIEYSQKVIKALSKPQTLKYLKKERGYYHTPVNALSVVLFALRDIHHCEVHFVEAGDRNDATSYYTRSNDCLALLAQDNYYMFYEGVPRYLSLKNLNLINMTTVQYHPEVLARHTNLEGLLFPCLIPYASSLTSDQKEFLMKIIIELDESKNASVAKKLIDERLNTKLDEILISGDAGAEEPFELQSISFYFQLLRYKYGFDYLKVEGPLNKWDLIRLKSQEMYESGVMSGRIKQILMNKMYFNECILEDFVDFPPSSAIYQPLRKMMYGVLFHEDTGIEDFLPIFTERSSGSADGVLHPGAQDVWEKKLYQAEQYIEPAHTGVYEWFMTRVGCLEEKEPVEPQQIDSTLHPGLLLLWDLDNETPDIRNKKWQLCASCISEKLSWQSLQSLPPTLVVPVIVLYYLFQVVPQTFMRKSWKYLEPWEVEVFLAQSVMLPNICDKTLSQITIPRINPRVVKLIAIFLYGCRTVSHLIETCGYPISRVNFCPLQFFDGKLFHSFYDRAEWRRSAMGLCDSEILPVFQQLKEIVCS